MRQLNTRTGTRAIRGRWLIVAALTVAIALGIASGASAATSGIWDFAGYGPGATLGLSGTLLKLVSISCPGAGDCVAVGGETSAGQTAAAIPVIVAESAGVWGPVSTVQVPSAADASKGGALTSVSCASATSCVAVGGYTNTSGADEPMTVAISVAGTSATAGTASTLALPTDADASKEAPLNGVSCTSAGACTAVGSYTSASDGSVWPMVAVLGAGGIWTATAITTIPSDAPGVTTSLTSISCPSGGGACQAAGNYGDSGGTLPWTVQVSGAVATDAEAVPLPANFNWPGLVRIQSISCPSAGVCTAAGFYPTADLLDAAMVVPITGGVPGTPVELNTPLTPLLATEASAIWCSDASDCTVGGAVTTGTLTDPSNAGGAATVATESGGTWSALTGLTIDSGYNVGQIAALSCVSAGVCTAAGYENDTSAGLFGIRWRAFFADEVPQLSQLTTPLPSATVGVPYRATLRGVGGAGAYKWSISVGSLPAGLSLNAATGTISGTPTTAGQNGFVVSLTDPGPPSQTEPANYSMTVLPASAPPPATGATSKAPVVSAVKLGAKRFAAKKGTTLRLTASQAAQIHVVITQKVTGHKVKGVCKRRAKTGKKCTIALTKRTLTLSAKAGANTFKLKLRGLARGAYTATITAHNANGTSRAIRLTFTITPA